MPDDLPHAWPPCLAAFFSWYPGWLPAVRTPLPWGWDMEIVAALTRLHALQYELLVRLELQEASARDGELHLVVVVADASPDAALALSSDPIAPRIQSGTGPGTVLQKVEEIRRDAVVAAARRCAVCSRLCTGHIGIWRYCALHCRP